MTRKKNENKCGQVGGVWYGGRTVKQHTNHPTKMKTLEIKKTPSGQYTYTITNSFGTLVPVQFGTYDIDTTVQQAGERFRFDCIRDTTECIVEVLGRDGKINTVHMTRDCFDKTKAKYAGSPQDQFLARITSMAGAEIQDDAAVPF